MFRLRFAGAVALIFLVTFYAAPFAATAQEQREAVLTPQEESALTAFAASLSEPLQVELEAQLLPPQTRYTTGFAKGELETFQKALSSSGALRLSIPFTEVHEWDVKISCGTWKEVKNDDGGEMSWSHPEGKPPGGCPHADGTDHDGTITAQGSYGFIVSKQDGSESLLETSWTFTCTYADGSVSGKAPCEEKLFSWGGRYGKLVRADVAEEVRSTQDRASGTYIGLTVMTVIVVSGVVFYGFKRRRKQQ
jgi:hypothetical protein